jgi:NAD(P)-dependent dehydrogenase (short-subunit alcohol dehydrogenase family)
VWGIDLSGSTALVTGASRGIGRAIALGLAQAGAGIAGVARSEDDLRSLCREVDKADATCMPIVADLANVDSIERIVNEAWEWQSSVDILVNAAGLIIRRDVPELTAEDFDRTMNVNVRASLLLAQTIGWRMRERRTGSIVNITSVAGEEVTGAPLTYQASKAALIQLTRGLASRLSPHVRVNAVGPGYIRTPLNEDWLSNEDNLSYVESRTASARVGAPQDVVGAVVFLASPAASYVNGQHLRVDGGWGI